jgi:hypothetical protein
MNNLCLSCSHSHIIRGHSISHEKIICSLRDWFRTELHWPVQQCDRYEDARARPPAQMKQIAWTLRVSKNRIVGFAPPQREED